MILHIFNDVVHNKRIFFQKYFHQESHDQPPVGKKKESINKSEDHEQQQGGNRQDGCAYHCGAGGQYLGSGRLNIIQLLVGIDMIFAGDPVLQVVQRTHELLFELRPVVRQRADLGTDNIHDE